MADFFAALIVIGVLMFFFDIVEGAASGALFIGSRIAEVIDILIEKLRGAGG